MDNYLALVLSAFIKSGLLDVSHLPKIFASVSIILLVFISQCIWPPQGLVEVITSSDDAISIRATILVGELLHMVPFSFALIH